MACRDVASAVPVSSPPNAAAVLRLLAIVAVRVDRPSGDYPMCRRGAHPMTPENTRTGRRHGMACRACKVEYNRRRRAGLPWDGAGRATGLGALGGAPRDDPLDPGLLARLRAAVGACPACGWARDDDAEPHEARRCALAASSEEMRGA